MTLEEKIRFIKEYAQDNKCYFDPEGEVGFGRECVGIIRDSHYPSWGWYEDDRTGQWWRSYVDGGGGPPIDESKEYPDSLLVPDAYHKADVLCVLGRGEAAIDQLYIWIKHLKDNDFIIGERNRRGIDLLDLAWHGATEAIVIRRGER
jgi:hypothetical protein